MLNYDDIKDYNYISFDLFDTLIFRSFSDYKKVFEFVEYQYNLQNDIAISHFLQKRLKAEKRARKKVNYKEINLDEIYNEISYGSSQGNVLKELEKEIEINTSIPNYEVIELLDKLHANGKKIIIMTDMYLPKDTIQSILLKNGIYFDYVFVSGEERKTKQQGDLFLHFLAMLGVDKSEIIHIGDNSISDYSVPKGLGINAVLYKRDVETFPYLIKSDNVLIDHYNSLICNGFSYNEKIYKKEYKIGFSVMGPVITSFCKWIHDIKEENDIDSLLFLAREGFAIQKVYEALYPEEIEYVQYARINKHILRIPLLSKDNLSELLKSTLKNKKYVTWRYIMDSLDIEDAVKERISLPEGQSLDSVVSIDRLDDPLYVDVKRNIVDALADVIDQQTELLTEYLCGLNIYNRKIGMVNNSYSGNGQKLLTRFINQNHLECNLLGIQFAADSACQKALKGKFVSWLNGQKCSLMAYLFERGSLIFEHLLFEPSGTAIRLDRDSNGKSTVVCEQTRTEQEDFEKIASYQAGMFDFAKLIRNNVCCNLDAESMQYFVNLIQNPTKEDALILGNLNDDDADVDRVINNYSEKFNLKYLYRNDIYNQVSWVQGFLRVKEIPDIYSKIFNLRLYATHYYHRLKK